MASLAAGARCPAIVDRGVAVSRWMDTVYVNPRTILGPRRRRRGSTPELQPARRSEARVGYSCSVVSRRGCEVTGWMPASWLARGRTVPNPNPSPNQIRTLARTCTGAGDAVARARALSLTGVQRRCEGGTSSVERRLSNAGVSSRTSPAGAEAGKLVCAVRRVPCGWVCRSLTRLVSK